MGLGAFPEQNHGTITNEKWHPIGYSLRALRDYEKRYTQIEKEILSIVFEDSFWRIFSTPPKVGL